VVQASPASNEEPLTLDTPARHLRGLAQMAGAGVIVCGHSHRPFPRQEGGVWFVNPSSVGRPDDGDPRASYATIQIDRNLLPEAFAEIVLQGRSLDALRQAAEVRVGSHN
jgi:predicted phosphodiesterase